MMARASRDNSSLEVTPTGIPSVHMCSMSAVDLALGGGEHHVLPLRVPTIVFRNRPSFHSMFWNLACGWMELIELSGWLGTTVSENVPTVPDRSRNWFSVISSPLLTSCVKSLYLLSTQSGMNGALPLIWGGL